MHLVSHLTAAPMILLGAKLFLLWSGISLLCAIVLHTCDCGIDASAEAAVLSS